MCRLDRFLLLCSLLALTACGDDPRSSDAAVGDMRDGSYGNLVRPSGTVYRVNANGREVSMDEFAGRYVWVDYAAPWCGPCRQQAGQLRRLAPDLEEDVVFLTVMTSDMGGYGDLPHVGTAAAWAKQYGLDPEHVLAARNLSSMTVPTHILFSPSGQKLYRSTGYLSSDQMTKILLAHATEYERWAAGGPKADWMR